MSSTEQIRKRLEKSGLTFDSWWERNKELYENSLVTKEIAGTIWTASSDILIKALKQEGKNV